MSYSPAKVAIIGAGSSGMIACRELKERGIAYDCFEKGDRAGGNWVFGNSNGVSAAYRSLHINTSRQQMEFLCYPMPDHLPHFPSHWQIAEYFDDFLNHFNLKPTITFNTKVQRVSPLEGGRWMVALDNGTKRSYDAVIVANGHHWDPRWPEPAFPGTFNGVTMHAHAYLDPESPHDLRGKNVVIVGMGNSAMDIACELGRRGVAKQVYLAVRSGMHIMPKYFGSKPADSLMRHPGQAPALWERIIPHRWFESLAFPFINHLIDRAVGQPEDFGIPKPTHKFGQAHPTISSEIHIRLGSGDVLPKPNIQELLGDRVRFVDGSTAAVDAIIYATGYHISFPFLDHDVLSFKQNDLPLFKRMIAPQQPNLLFIGLVQPLCSIMPIAEQQARFIGEYLLGRYDLPDQESMTKDAISKHEEMKSRYVHSQRHTIQINCMEYTADLWKELKRGQKRAQSRLKQARSLTGRQLMPQQQET